MPTVRKTAAEKRAEAAALRNAEFAVEYAAFVQAYPTRFANVMFKYMELPHADFRVKKLDDETYAFSRTDYSWKSLELKVNPPAEPDWDYMNVMLNVEEYLADYAKDVAEQMRKHNVKQAALQKLSTEERELLGL